MGAKKVIKAVVKRVRDGKNAIGSEYTRYFKDEAQKARVMESMPAVKAEVKRVRERNIQKELNILGILKICRMLQKLCLDM